MDDADLQAQLYRLTQEHRDLDAAIDALAKSPATDMLAIARLKKRKLLLKDEIAAVHNMLTPDIIA